MKKIIIICSLVLIQIFGCTTTTIAQVAKPRVIVMTDGEIDDHSSMIRFLLYTCDVEVCAIIETNSIFQKNGHSDEDWYENQLDAYEEIYPNLIKHNPDYPTAAYLRSISSVGDEVYDRVKDLREKRWELIPGGDIMMKPDNWDDTPGSDKIVEILLEENPDPVHIQAWGGGNTAARTFYKLKTEYPDDYKRAVSKVVMYNIWYQDGAGNYIENYHPDVTMIYCGSFAGTWNYKSQKKSYEFIKNNVQNNHEPLGALYPQDYISEGDSPAFLYSLQNGLRNYEHPTFGGWGGRFEQSTLFDQVYMDAVDDGDKKKSLRIWVEDANADFKARMDWCVADDYSKANHHPIIKIKGDVNKTFSSGKKVSISASKTIDPDGDKLTYKWWQYKEAGTYKSLVNLQGADSDKVSFIVPQVDKPETIHIILEVSDDGQPTLKSYQRIVVAINP